MRCREGGTLVRLTPVLAPAWLALMMFCAATAAQGCTPALANAITDTALSIGAGNRWHGDDGLRIQSEMERIREGCARGHEVEAVWRLEQVQALMTRKRPPALSASLRVASKGQLPAQN